ncbi:MAG: hypothetical protein JRJ42_09400 [Deltaproteobacteria bacterium]|nr:hypothetical protein [Deltaproteobacteria bacterium]
MIGKDENDKSGRNDRAAHDHGKVLKLLDLSKTYRYFMTTRGAVLHP